MEKILQQILEGQLETTKELKRLSEGQTKLFEGQTQINQRLDNIDNRLNNVENHLSNVEGRLDKIKGNLAENNRFIHALSQDVAKTATKEDIYTLSASIETLNTRLFKQETELTLLKTAK